MLVFPVFLFFVFWGGGLSRFFPDPLLQWAGDTPHGNKNEQEPKQSTPLLQWAGDTPHGNKNKQSPHPPKKQTKKPQRLWVQSQGLRFEHL
jgi:hypothetical protein